MKIFNNLKNPTIIIDEDRVRANIAVMQQKTTSQGIRFRPHFKTHQSAAIGNWFREMGIRAITVSSLKMARYFSENGWTDILIAFPVNVRELDELAELSQKIHLGVLIDHPDVARNLFLEIGLQADVWIKIDTGMGRAGIHWENKATQLAVARNVLNCSHLNLRGLLAHAGQTYHTDSAQAIKSLYSESTRRINDCRKFLEKEINKGLEVSVGDTPGCWLSEDLGAVDEVRPGNFIFFDAMMFKLGVCKADEIALCVACPVVSKYKERLEVLIHGGAVHLSKEMIENSSPVNYGFMVLTPESNRWNIRETNFLRSLSQEHGIIKLDKETFGQISIGDMIYIIPVHSCLVVSALAKYLTLGARWIEAKISL